MSLEVILMSLMSLGVISLCLRKKKVRLMSLGLRLMSLGVGLEQEELGERVWRWFGEFDEFGVVSLCGNGVEFDEFGKPFATGAVHPHRPGGESVRCGIE